MPQDRPSTVNAVHRLGRVRDGVHPDKATRSATGTRTGEVGGLADLQQAGHCPSSPLPAAIIPRT